MTTREELVKAVDDARAAWYAAYDANVSRDALESARYALDAAYIALKAYDEENA